MRIVLATSIGETILAVSIGECASFSILERVWFISILKSAGLVLLFFLPEWPVGRGKCIGTGRVTGLSVVVSIAGEWLFLVGTWL